MPIIVEDLYVDWVSKEIADIFGKIGFSVKYTAVSQPVEKDYPFDRLYGISSDTIGIGLFAIQFKAPEKHRYGLKFAIDLNQLESLKKGEFLNWIYYGFPFFTHPLFQSSCLHLINFVRPFMIPPLNALNISSIYWRPPYFFVEFKSDISDEVKEKVESHKVFDEFFSRGKNEIEFILTRKACVYLENKERFEIPHYSWGELFNSLITERSGKFIKNKDELEKFIETLKNIKYRPSNAILIALDLIRNTIRVVAILSGHEKEFCQNKNDLEF